MSLNRLLPLARLPSRLSPRPVLPRLLTTVTSVPSAQAEPSAAAAAAARPHHAVVSLAGQDRVGIVRTVTAAVAAQRANVEDSKMAILGGDFAMIVYVSMEDRQHADQLVAQLKAELPSFTISVRETSPPTQHEIGHLKTMWTMQFEGPDQPGIVAAVTQALATHGANVHEMDTETTTAPFAGYTLFKMNGKFAVDDEHLEEVSKALTKLEDKYGSTINLDQVPAKE